MLYEQIKKRRVKVRHYDYRLYHVDASNTDIKIDDRGFRTEPGWFAGYGLDYHETENGVASFTVAIVEMEDNTIKLTHVSNIQFL